MFFVPPLFLAYWYQTNQPQGSRIRAVKIDRYFLDWHRHLYDTHDLYHGVNALDDIGITRALPPGGLAPTERQWAH